MRNAGRLQQAWQACGCGSALGCYISSMGLRACCTLFITGQGLHGGQHLFTHVCDNAMTDDMTKHALQVDI